ncbi:exodeoxyribonuclease V subunit gamma [Candidatus Pacearchaeota archaeon]|nr:exodeoxyribonuclease V subunit gamma [Candidatus Pacearchaeota archaeon]
MGDENLEYTKILKALMELPFQVGKTLLADFLNGDYKNKSITKNNLDELHNFDSLHWSKNRIYQEIDKLITHGMIEFITSDYNRFVKVLRLTIKGQNEIIHPTLPKKELKNKIKFKRTEVTEKDKEIFEALKGFLGEYNDEQKKAIISKADKILCVAGAGSGKTTVLTKRIEFLVKYRGVSPEKILAITFTRKARQEMERRLYELNVSNKVKVHTFNSFCEEILRKHGNKIYGRPTKVQSYADKILAMNMALGNLGIDMEDALQSYFTPQQRKFKTGNQLANSFMNDCFSVMDYFKVTGEEEYDFSKNVDIKNRHNAQRVYQIIKYLKEHMTMQGLRDYTDQILDATKFLEENTSEIPEFEHILIDEYQDVNAMQAKLINLLKPKNLFAVGDPRQSIFGWRGADINYILNFEKDYADSEIVHLTKNYRSTKEIVQFINHAITSMELPDLEHHLESEDTKIKIINFESEEAERDFVVKKILNSKIPRDEIFVLVRTNRQLQELSQLMKKTGISHILKTDEIQNSAKGKMGDITLATIHAIKGLEAKKVFIVGCNEQNFPCKASDHPAIEMIKTDDYNKLEEERRLFYVAISRAKEILYLTYSGKKRTYFITGEMIETIEKDN